MKKLKRLGALLLTICLMAAMVPSEAFAASASVSVSSASGTVGSSVSVTCTAKMSGADIGGADITIQYSASGLELVSCSSGANGGSGSVSYSGYATGSGTSSLSFTMNFKIIKEGTHSVSVSYADVFDFEAATSVSTSKGSGSITGKAQTTSGGTTSSGNSGGSTNSGSTTTTPTTPSTPETPKDNNSKLKSLDVYPGKMIPAFDKNKTAYTVEATNEVTNVTITAVAESSKAKVTVSGGKDLKLGENSAKIVVTAEDGSTTVYSILIVCGEVEKIDINGVEHRIDESFGYDVVPEGFTAVDNVTYNNRDYWGCVNESGTITLMSLTDGESAKFFVYDKVNNVFYDFIPVKIAEGRYIYLKNADKENVAFSGYEVTPFTVNDREVDVWKLDDEFCVFSAWDMNWEDVVYRYDSVDGIYQRFAELPEVEPELPEEPVEEVSELEAFLAEYYLYLIAGLAGLSFLLLVIVIILAATRKSKRGKRKAKERGKAKEEGPQDIEIQEINLDEE